MAHCTGHPPILHTQVMSGPVTPPQPGTGFSAKLVASGGNLSLVVTVPPYYMFAARTIGGGALVADASGALNQTAGGCTAQVYQVATAMTPTNYTIAVTGATKDTYVALGFTNGSFGPGLFAMNATQPTKARRFAPRA